MEAFRPETHELTLAGGATHDIKFPILDPVDGILGEFTSELQGGWQIAAPHGETGLPVLQIR